jgi:hypothetical protein
VFPSSPVLSAFFDSYLAHLAADSTVLKRVTKQTPFYNYTTDLLLSELDNLVGSDCPICGEHVVGSINLPYFDDFIDAVEKRQFMIT